MGVFGLERLDNGGEGHVVVEEVEFEEAGSLVAGLN